MSDQAAQSWLSSHQNSIPALEMHLRSALQVLEDETKTLHDLADVGTLPPIMYPGKILNAAVNFYSHVNETGSDEERAEARR